MTGPSTGDFQMPVRTCLPRQATFRGNPTFTETSVVIGDSFNSGGQVWGSPPSMCPKASRAQMNGLTCPSVAIL
jgi:hypothetical protein